MRLIRSDPSTLSRRVLPVGSVDVVADAAVVVVANAVVVITVVADSRAFPRHVYESSD